MIRASRSKRSRASGSAEIVEERILIATERSSRVSRALYTSPIPPAPIAVRISYGPRRVPGVNGMASRFRERALPVQDRRERLVIGRLRHDGEEPPVSRDVE